MQLSPFIHIDDFEHIRINGPFELVLLSPRLCKLSGQGFTLTIEALDTIISTMNVDEVTINVRDLTRLELRKMDIV